MTYCQLKLVELDKRKDEVKKFFEELSQAVKDVESEIGVNGTFQDNEGIVYKITIPEGKFVHFEPLSYVRTKRPHEKRGDLSMKEAEEAGYILPNR